jgi:hypothetical protein
MKQKVNYIVHLNNAFQKLNQDDRLSPFHVSLYYSLFQYWNISKFRNPISISRDDQMQASKIGSVNTYLKCLKELDHWGYIKYEPSHNPMKGSLVYLFIFDNSTNTTNNITSNTTSDNGSNNSSGKSSETTLKKVLRPSKNNSNKSNKLNSKKANASTRKKIDSKSNAVTSISKRKKVAPKKEKSSHHSSVTSSEVEKRPSLYEVEAHFASKEWPAIEAQKFFNYYSSNGWLVGGKTPMQSWKACASNWMLNSQKFNNGKKNQSNSVTSSGVEKRPRPGILHTSTDKNYSEPL